MLKEENKEKTQKQKHTMKRVLQDIGHYRWMVLLSLLLAGITVALTLYIPIPVSYTHLSGGTAGGLYGGRSLRDGSCAGRRMPELPGSGTALCGLCCFKQKKSSFISKHGQGSCLPERTVFLYKGRKLLQGADGAQLGKCQDASRKRQRASGQCHMAVGRQTGKRRLCENKVALLLLLISCSFY